MAVNETIVTGRKFRKLIDEATKQWQKISFWHKASDCEFNDGKTAETKVGAIDGITDSLASTSSKIAASAKSVNTLNNNLAKVKTYVGSDGKLHFTNSAGADTVLNFSSGFNGVKMYYLKKIGDSSSYLSQNVSTTTGHYNYGATYTSSTRKTTIVYPGKYCIMICDNNGYAAFYVNDVQKKTVSFASEYFTYDLKKDDIVFFTGSQDGASAYIEKISD